MSDFKLVASTEVRVGTRVVVRHGRFSDGLAERRGIVVTKHLGGYIVYHFDGSVFGWSSSEVEVVKLSWWRDLWLCLRLGWKAWSSRRRGST